MAEPTPTAPRIPSAYGVPTDASGGELLPGVVVYGPVSILVVYLSVRCGRPRLSLLVSVIGLVVTAAASIVFIPRYGASGAAVASGIGYAAGGLAAWISFVRVAGLTLLGRSARH